MPLHPQVRALLDAQAALGLPPRHTLSPEAARALARAGRDAYPPGRDVAEVSERMIPGPAGELRVRIYRPHGAADPAPALVYMHGGGFVLCDLDTHDNICRNLAALAGVVVVSVDYRLAPEAKFPAPLDDCVAATRWTVEQAPALRIDPDRIAVGGDSAGGNLAAATALRLKAEGGPAIAAELLIYPVTDHPEPPSASFVEFAENHGLTAVDMRWFWDQYLAEPAQAADPFASVLRAPDLAGLPPTFLFTAECDVLRDEGEAYAARLRDAGVDVTFRRYPGLHHGFLGLADMLEAGAPALADAADWLRRVLA